MLEVITNVLTRNRRRVESRDIAACYSFASLSSTHDEETSVPHENSEETRAAPAPATATATAAAAGAILAAAAAATGTLESREHCQSSLGRGEDERGSEKEQSNARKRKREEREVEEKRPALNENARQSPAANYSDDLFYEQITVRCC